MQKELEALIKANQALRMEAVTPMTPIRNVVLVGFADPMLAPMEYGVETEVVNPRQVDKKKRVERLKCANSIESFKSANWD